MDSKTRLEITNSIERERGGGLSRCYLGWRWVAGGGEGEGSIVGIVRYIDDRRTVCIDR